MNQEPAKTAFPSPWQTLGLLGIFIAFSIAISVLLSPFLGNDPGNMPAWFIFVGTAVPMGGTVWIAQIWRGGGSFFLQSVPPHLYILGVLLGMPVAGLAGILVEVLQVPDFLEEMLKGFLEEPGIFSFLAIVVGHVLRAIIPLADDVDASRTTALRGRREAVDGLGGPSYVFCKSAIANRER